MLIESIEIKGFKSLVLDEPIKLGRVNCFIGANGVGKSNVLEALGVLGAAASGSVNDESLLRRGVRASVPSLYKNSFKDERGPSSIGFTAHGVGKVVYGVSLQPDSTWSYKSEYWQDECQTIIAADERSHSNLNVKAGLAALKTVNLAEDNQALQLLSDLQHYAIYTPNTPMLRAITPDQQTREPVGLNGGNLAEGFDLLQKYLSSLGETGEDILDEVLQLIDWVNDVAISTQAAKILSASVPRTKNVIKFTDRFMTKSRNELTAYDASEGALYVLFTAILSLLPQSPRIFAIDNLDQALNPRLVSRLVERLVTWLQVNHVNKQLLFTAHNPAVLDGLDLANPDVRLFTVQRNNRGFTRVAPIVLSDKLLALNQQYPLSRLWLMGNLGALPNV